MAQWPQEGAEGSEGPGRVDMAGRPQGMVSAKSRTRQSWRLWPDLCHSRRLDPACDSLTQWAKFQLLPTSPLDTVEAASLPSGATFTGNRFAASLLETSLGQSWCRGRWASLFCGHSNG